MPRNKSTSGHSFERLEREQAENAGSILAGMLTVQQAANYLGIARSVLYRLISEGKAPTHSRYRNRILFHREHLDKWTQAQ